jgi:hypothetical protein
MTNAIDAATRTKIAKLMRMLGTDQPGELDNVRAAINRILGENGCTWNDLPDLFGASDEVTADCGTAPWSDVDDTVDGGAQIAAGGLLDLVVSALREHLQLEEQEYLVVALWAMHSHVFDHFAVTPRLALVSPVRGCGKTTLLEMLANLCQRGSKFDGVSGAALFRMIDTEQPTLLLDEVDTHDLGSHGLLRGVLNSGHRRGGRIARAGRAKSGQQEHHEFSTFAPVAVATIGLETLPLPLQHRSIFVEMRRADGEREIRRLDDMTEAGLKALGNHLGRWAMTATLEKSPEMPPELKNRAADNWRPLIAIADACGGDWGLRAREAAIAMSGRHADEDLGVTLLQDIRAIFARAGAERMSSRDLVAALNDIDDAPWSEWRGRNGNQQPRPLSQTQLAQLLRPFGIRPRSLWPGPRPQGRSAKGYFRSQFEVAWRSYCSSPTSRSQPNVLKLLKQ